MRRSARSGEECPLPGTTASGGELRPGPSARIAQTRRSTRRALHRVWEGREDDGYRRNCILPKRQHVQAIHYLYEPTGVHRHSLITYFRSTPAGTYNEVGRLHAAQQPYGISCDWYTVGVLLYDANGALPYTKRDTDSPLKRDHIIHAVVEQRWAGSDSCCTIKVYYVQVIEAIIRGQCT